MINHSATLRAAVLGWFAASVLTGADPDPIYKALREAPIAEVLNVENVEVRRDAGTIVLKSGSIAFTGPALGRDTVAVFSGEGEFTLTPAVTLERNYIKSLTDQELVKDTFGRAVFCFTDDTSKEIRS
jgi:hypothetical protein